MNILFVKLGAIGDVVQAAAAIKAYRNVHPINQLTWVAGKTVIPLIKLFEVADQIIEVDDKAILASGGLKRLIATAKCIAEVARLKRQERIVTAYADRRYRLLTMLSRTDKRQQFDAQASRPSPIQHRSRVYEYWRLLGGELDGLDINAAMKSLWTPQLLAAVATSRITLPETGYIAIVPGGARNMLRSDDLRRWPLDRYVNLARKLLANGMNVVLVGGPDDRWTIEAFSGLPIMDFIGKTSLIDALFVFSNAQVVVSHDCGPMHLAAITETSLVALFGPTPANTFLPLGRANTVALYEGNRIACSPCYDGKNYAPCSSNRCLQAISVDQVFSAVCTLSTHAERTK